VLEFCFRLIPTDEPPLSPVLLVVQFPMPLLSSSYSRNVRNSSINLSIHLHLDRSGKSVFPEVIETRGRTDRGPEVTAVSIQKAHSSSKFTAAMLFHQIAPPNVFGVEREISRKREVEMTGHCCVDRNPNGKQLSAGLSAVASFPDRPSRFRLYLSSVFGSLFGPSLELEPIRRATQSE
jgi:hypothetical protein